MNTRGTYQIIESGMPTVTVIVKYDNYPEAAADYFNDNQGIGMAERFVNAVPCAELTIDHEYNYDPEDPEDPEYRYDIFDEKVMAFEKKGHFWVVFFDGTLVDFIEKYRE